MAELRRPVVQPRREPEARRRPEPAVVTHPRAAEPEPRRVPVERGSRSPQSTGEPELRRRKPERVKP
jgi:hypothetical protein